MSILEAAGLFLLHRVDPEVAHALALRALKAGLAPAPGPISGPRLTTEVAGLKLPNPLGLAAGFDKNAEALAPLMQSGFGFLEVGAATPQPQEGNPRPRLYRLSEDRAAINRFGFNNEGAEQIARRLAERPEGIPVGLNLGANKTSADRSADFADVLTTCGPFVDFATVNVSSPNTERLRDLQAASALRALIEGVLSARDRLSSRVPVFLKIAPDLEEAEIANVADIALQAGIDGLVATNTTLDRSGLKSRHRTETGGLSGAPLFERSTRVLAQLSEFTGGRIPIIGVGGVSSGRDIYRKIQAGASAVQLYTGLVYQGMGCIQDMLGDLDRLLEEDGFANVADAVGSKREEWLPKGGS